MPTNQFSEGERKAARLARAVGGAAVGAATGAVKGAIRGAASLNQQQQQQQGQPAGPPPAAIHTMGAAYPVAGGYAQQPAYQHAAAMPIAPQAPVAAGAVATPAPALPTVLPHLANRPNPLSYPWQGLVFFLGKPALWAYAAVPLGCGLVISALALSLVFALCLEPQQELLEDLFSSSGVAWLCAVLLCLVEALLLTFIFLQAAMGFAMEKVFVETMKLEKEWGEGEDDDCSCREQCWWFGFQLVVALATLPLNFAPVVGTMAFCAINGALVAWEYHELYFDMRKSPHLA